MSDKLRLEVILAAVDKVTGPLKGVIKGSRETAAAVSEAQLALKKMEAEQRKLQRLQSAMPAMGRERNAMRVEQAKLDALTASGTATAKQIKAQEQALQQQTSAYERQRAVVLRLRAELNAMGVGNTAQAQQRLASGIAAANTQLELQNRKLDAQRKIEERLQAVRGKHEKQMHRIAMAGALAAGSAHVGQRMGGALMQPVAAFADSESASSQLKAAMMGADGSVAPEFARINALAGQLGDKLPGTTADFVNMMTMLRRQGLSAQSILGGTGEAAAYLGVQLKMPATEAAEFAAKMQDATQTTEADMMGLMDLIQRTYYLGLDSGNMLQGFTKAAAVMPLLGKKGLQASSMIAPLLVMMDQAGMKGEAAGNAIRKVVQLGMDAEKLGKANKMLQGTGVQLEFFDQAGKFAGLDNLFEQMGKLKGLENDVERIAAIKKLFGDDAETHQVLDIMMAKGKGGYDEVVAKMQQQADLRKRVEAELQTLKAVAEAAQGSFTNMLSELGASIAPELKTLLEWLGELAVKMGAWARENPTVVKTLMLMAAGVAGLLTVVGTLGLVLAATLGPLLALRMGFAMWRLSMLGAQAAAVGAAPGMGLLYRAGFMLGRAFAFLRMGAGLGLTGLRVLAAFLIANPIVIAIGLLAAAAYLLYTRWEDVVGGFKLLMQDIGDAVTGAAQYVWGLGAQFFEAGAAIVQGMANGITSRIAAVRDAISMAAGDAIDWFKEKLGIHSPSRVFMQLGSYVGEGAALGIQNGEGMVRQAALGMATASMVPMAAMGAPAAAGPASGGSTYQITINAAPGMDGQEIARAVAAELDRREREQDSRRYSRLSDID